MLKAERVEYIQRRLQELYPEPPVPLDHSDPFTLLIAVLLSAQCTDERVNQVTPELFRLADNPLAMSVLGEERIRAIIRPCGLSPQKAAAISRLSAILLDDHDGEVPADMAALERLPGVGHKPASVVMTYGTDQVIAFSTASGSGAKYTTSGVEFWEHHGEATVDWFGKKWKCKVIR